MKRGEPFHQNKSWSNSQKILQPDKVMKDYIYSKGKKGIYLWIISVAKGIMQLEKLGIYYFDFALRNTIFESN